jgi:hypothetical protein
MGVRRLAVACCVDLHEHHHLLPRLVSTSPQPYIRS